VARAAHRENKMPEQRQQVPLDPKEHDNSARNFLIGLLAGLAASGVVFFLIRAFVVGHFHGEWIFSTYHPVILLLPVLGMCKIAIAVALLFTRTWKAMGAGLLASFAICFMIFLGMCAVDMIRQ
jgi:ABC-type iron transport system FetAB permease component